MSTVLVYSIHKSGTMFLHRLLKRISRDFGIEHISANYRSNRRELMESDWQSVIEQHSGPRCFGPIRQGQFAPMFPQQLENYRIILHLRDPHNDEKYLPQDYPVLYLMDGGAHFHYASGMMGFMGGFASQIPEMILVAVPHINRTKELTPTNSNISFQGKETQTFKDSGGADEFLNFLTDELIPQIDKDFRARPYRILVGHSFAGLFAAQAFLEKPDAFQAWVMMDPSFWWDNKVMVSRLSEAVKSDSFRQREDAVYISLAQQPVVSADNEDLQQGVENHFSGVRQFAGLLQASQAPKLRTELRHFDQETHGSIPILTLYHALLHTFDGYAFPTELLIETPAAESATNGNKNHRVANDPVPLHAFLIQQFPGEVCGLTR